MRNRLSLYLNSLSLEEMLYLEEEIDRRKDRYRETYAVLSVQTDRRVLQTGNRANLGAMARDMRKYIADCAAQGGGMQLAYSPEVSVIMFTTVEGASRTCSSLLSKLPELNGRSMDGSYQVNLKLGLACGEDILSPGSPRSVRTSVLVNRANQAAWRSSAGTLLMDERSYEQWPEKHKVSRMPIEIDGQPIYRAVPCKTGNAEAFDNERLNEFLAKVSRAGITTLKYDLERQDDVKGAVPKSEAIADLHLEGYDFKLNENLKYTERLSAGGYADRLESIRRILSDMGLALVRFDTASSG